MKHIGGFFELEIPQGSWPWHSNAIELNTGRACILAILQSVKPKRLHLPFYICDTVLRAVAAAGVTPVFYALNRQLRPVTLPHLEGDDMLFVVNYFGLQSEYTNQIGSPLGDRCIVDNTQAFFEPATPGCWTLYSARKFFGVPDGAYLYAPQAVSVKPRVRAKPDIRHLVNRLAGRQQTAYRQCRAYEANLAGNIRQMSLLSERLLSAYDYAAIRVRRRENYLALHDRLGAINRFDAGLNTTAAPMLYPLLGPEIADRAAIAKHRLYIPTTWQDVIDRKGGGFEFERAFAAHLLPLPIDQRYDKGDMEDLLTRLGPVVDHA
jgi:hypothetical protein